MVYGFAASRAHRLDLAGVNHSRFSQRQAADLDGQWHCIVDPHRNGFDAFQKELDAPNPKGFIANQAPDPRGPVQEYDWPMEPTLAVPGDWNSQRPKLLYYEGMLWCQRTFTYHPHAGMRSFLHFGAEAQGTT